jgi:hypothetical protein
VADYRVLVTHEVFSLQKPKARESALILGFLDRLAESPFQTGDYEEKDEVGRPVQIKIIGSFALSFWADHVSKEVKVIKIEKADRR